MIYMSRDNMFIFSLDETMLNILSVFKTNISFGCKDQKESGGCKLGLVYIIVSNPESTVWRAVNTQE